MRRGWTRKFVVQGLYRLTEHPPEWFVNEGYDYVVFSQRTAGCWLTSVQGTVTRMTKRLVEKTLRQTMQDLNPDAEPERPNDPPCLSVRNRYAAGEVLDELALAAAGVSTPGRCAPAALTAGGDLLAMKYPVTNHQFQRFIDADGYENDDYWGGKDSVAWRWRVKEHGDYRGKGPGDRAKSTGETRVSARAIAGYPVVGVSWYEAVAYASLAERAVER